MAAGSPDYTIDVLADQPPAVTFLKPGRDAKVTSIEEVFTEMRAEDDFGVARAELVYSVNGGPEKSVVLHQGRGRKSVSAGHTFFMEELSLEPGDFISYFGRAADESAARQTTTTDIYFMEVRPFAKEYKQAEERGAKGAPGGDNGGALSYQQRQIIAATFKIVRDKRAADKQAGEDLATLALVQGRLHDQVQSLIRAWPTAAWSSPAPALPRPRTRCARRRSRWRPPAGSCRRRRPRRRLPPSSGALKHLQRAEAAFREVQVGFGSGGAKAAAARAERGRAGRPLRAGAGQARRTSTRPSSAAQQQQADDQVDEALERLRELARGRSRRRAHAPAQSGGPPGMGEVGQAAQQRELAEETEELARRLERLAREKSSPGLQETARRLQEAANAMRRSSTGGESGALARVFPLSTASRTRGGRSSRAARPAPSRTSSARWTPPRRSPATRTGSPTRYASWATAQEADAERVQRLDERKDALAGQVQTLEQQLDRMASDTRSSAATASRALREAASGIRENKLKEKIRYSKGVVRGRPGEAAQQFEAEIGKDVDQLSRQVTDAAQALSEAKGDSRSAALERTRDLVRRMESIQERLKQGPAAGEAGSRQGPASASPGEAGRGASDGAGSRQLRREFRQRAEDARGIGTQLAEGGGTPGDLREIERKLRRLERSETWGSLHGVETLVAQALEDLKMFEYSLRRELQGTDPEKLRLSGSDDVPDGWRSLVEEYYRSLARSQK